MFKILLMFFYYLNLLTQLHCLNQWFEFGAGLPVWQTNDRQEVCSGSLFENNHIFVQFCLVTLVAPILHSLFYSKFGHGMC